MIFQSECTLAFAIQTNPSNFPLSQSVIILTGLLGMQHKVLGNPLSLVHPPPPFMFTSLGAAIHVKLVT